MAHKKQGYRFEDDWENEFLQDHLKDWEQAITLPVNIEIKTEHRVLNLEYAQELLENAETIARMNCACRTSKQNCDAPIDNCISLNNRANMILTNENYKDRNPRSIELEEAIEMLKDSHKAGLVHMAYAVDDHEINELCSCCSCCCVALSATLRYGLYPHLLTAVMVQQTDSSKCFNCGLCIERCQFGAREIVDGKLVVDNSLCYGCGLCISSCAVDAIKLHKKKH
jgi:Pyruvate/2-oxoacid:ferredoxin oxidoreductase delta subunit